MLCLSQCQSDSAITRTCWAHDQGAQPVETHVYNRWILRRITAVHSFPDSRSPLPVLVTSLVEVLGWITLDASADESCGLAIWRLGGRFCSGLAKIDKICDWRVPETARKSNAGKSFLFSGIASSCILRISDSETLAKREFTPAILFLLGSRIIHSVSGE